MLKVTSKNYEIEEKVQFVKTVDDKEEIQYEFVMKITNDEMQELKDIMFGYSKENITNYLKISKEEKEELEKELKEEQQKKDDRFIDICFKEHKNCKEIVGEYKFNEMLEIIRSYIANFFMEKQISQYNIPITNLTRIMNNFQKLK